MKKLSVTLTVPILATRPTSLRPRSSSIRCSARSFGSASSSASSAASSPGRRAARPRAGDRPDDDLAVAHPHQDLRARDDDLEAAEIEVAEIGRGVDPPQRPVEREGRQVEPAREALRQHDLEGVAGGDVFLRLRDHRLVLGLGRVGDRLARGDERVGRLARAVVERRLERGHDRVEPRLGRLVRRLGRDAGRRADRRHDRHLVARRVEHHHHGRPDEQHVRARRSGRAWPAAAAPSGAPCRSRDSRTRRPTSAAAPAAGRCAIPASSALSAASGSPGTGDEGVGRRERAAG